MMRIRSLSIYGAVACAAVLLQTSVALAGVHTWDVNEVFSNADGSVQFVELWESAGGAGEVGVPGQTLSSIARSFTITGAVLAPPASNKFYLLATAEFAALPGAPVPDAIIPPGPPTNIAFFDIAGDTVAFGGFDNWAFGAVPTNGTDSLDRFLGVGANSPTNYAGDTGSVAAPPSVPLTSWSIGLVLTALVLLSGFAVLSRRHQTQAAHRS
jgi:serralysin